MKRLPMAPPDPLGFAGMASPCIANSCTVCCHDTEMPLLPDDTARLQAVLGLGMDAFSRIDEDGVRRLRNQGGRCVFLQATGCGVYADRPAGCRVYPLVWDPEKRAGVLDPDCPYRKGFRIRPRDRAALTALVDALLPR